MEDSTRFWDGYGLFLFLYFIIGMVLGCFSSLLMPFNYRAPWCKVKNKQFKQNIIQTINRIWLPIKFRKNWCKKAKCTFLFKCPSFLRIYIEARMTSSKKSKLHQSYRQKHEIITSHVQYKLTNILVTD